MADHISIHKADGAWVVRAGGAVIAESRGALELTEGDHPPVIYFPREDVAMAFLDPTETRTTNPYKGEACYFTINTGHGDIADAAWSYEDPMEGVERIAGYIAFYPDKATVEQL
ncbi:uncharacterized protein Ga0609869_000380 [Rhodovulum iodosum]|uniref:DUF427 domain-containing protein n=1 Tax=Rhodovulum iodosum TaxID=68291 RepID=A0ABV3XNX9_9RHOB|nr:DUF427 domain-containing protein [Rhodovulum robiginosum]RSK37968.1 DUF427 domain-containing protein [Rhodovulum robiginosum]